jgi:undecaprenyl pyrophosphate phosphatase UppP
MDLMLLLKAAILGIVEAQTAFLPISSTGCLILAGALLDLNDERAKLFMIMIVVVIWECRARLGQALRHGGHEARTRALFSTDDLGKVVGMAASLVPAFVMTRQLDLVHWVTA